MSLVPFKNIAPFKPEKTHVDKCLLCKQCLDHVYSNKTKASFFWAKSPVVRHKEIVAVPQPVLGNVGVQGSDLLVVPGVVQVVRLAAGAGAAGQTYLKSVGKESEFVGKRVSDMVFTCGDSRQVK